jgi:ADP-ribosylglycohydrolase
MQNLQHATTAISRAQGCLLGQFAGDSLGGLVEFQRPESILLRYPNGVTELADGGTWDNVAGQLTDDSEMALMLARCLVTKGTYTPESAFEAYVQWKNSHPFDMGYATRSALSGSPNPDTQANGALMRISPLGIFGTQYPAETVAQWADADAALTHPHTVPRAASVLFAMAIAYVIRTGCTAQELYDHIVLWAHERNVPETLLTVISAAATQRPTTYIHQQGWVLIAFQNALWQLLHADSFRNGVQDTVMQGGDTDTNAAICGALLGAVYGREAVPQSWIDALLQCRPSADNPRTRHPRPEIFWPVDVLSLATNLLGHSPTQ